MIRPKRIHFPEHCCCSFDPNLCFWIQLTRADTVFCRIALVSRFCAENQLLGKTPEIIVESLFYPKTPGARRRDREGQGGPHTTWPHGGPMAARAGGVEASGTPSRASFDYLTPFDLKTSGGYPLFTKPLRNSAAIANPLPGVRNSVLAPYRDGD